MVSVRRRRAKCGLIPAVWDLAAILLSLPPTLSSMPPVRSASDKTGVRQSFAVSSISRSESSAGNRVDRFGQQAVQKHLNRPPVFALAKNPQPKENWGKNGLREAQKWTHMLTMI